jgi:hypothetical protein
VAGLLDPLTDDQQRLVDLVAESYEADEQWPIFDFIEGTFDNEGRDAASTLASFPNVGRWGYSSVWWVGMHHFPKPPRETEIELSLLGWSHSNVLAGVVEVFFDVIELMINRRRHTPLSRRTPRELAITSADVEEMIASQRRRSPLLPGLIFRLLQHEPELHDGTSELPDGTWQVGVSRRVSDYAGVHTIDEYIKRLERFTVDRTQTVALVAPSPLDVVAALDYLDAEWRARHRRPLLTYPSAERCAKLTLGAATTEELDARLSALAEILRSANKSATAGASRKLKPASFDDPLAPFEDAAVATVLPAGVERVRQAVTTLEQAIALRDAAQHSEATGRALAALRAFNLDARITDAPAAWSVISDKVREALGAIREEVAAATP